MWPRSSQSFMKSDWAVPLVEIIQIWASERIVTCEGVMAPSRACPRDAECFQISSRVTR